MIIGEKVRLHGMRDALTDDGTINIGISTKSNLIEHDIQFYKLSIIRYTEMIIILDNPIKLR